jgi:4-nitrophenyl phosphatase
VPFRLYVFDLDGTIYRGSEPLPHAAESVAELRKRGAAVRFITNNSGMTRADLASKLGTMGIQASPKEIQSSGCSAAQLCAKKNIERVFLVGEPGLVAEFESFDRKVVNRDPSGRVCWKASEKAQAVVAGICRGFDYAIMSAALNQILDGAKFIATNEDPTYPIEGGKLEPGAGAVVAAIRTCSGTEPEVVGKPNPTMIKLILEETRISPKETLVVGDRVDTDIAAGKAAGCEVHLVLTGVTRQAPPGIPFGEDLRGVLAR